MYANNNFVAAVDIGTTKIVAIVGKKKENGKLEILGMGKSPSTGVKRGMVLNIEATIEAIKKVTEEARVNSGIAFSDVFVGIAGQHIKSIQSHGYIIRESYEDEITDKDVDRLIGDMYKIPIDAGEEIIHVLPQGYIVDNEVGVRTPVGMSGKRLAANFHIVIGQIASANNIKKCVKRVGLNVNGLVLEPLASSQAVLTEDEKEVGVALVDIGGGTTDIAVYYDGIIRHTAVIPYGGYVITNDIKTGFSILERQAELLKLQYGSALAEMAQEDKVVTIPGISGREPKEISFKALAHVIQSRMEEIIGAIYFELESSGFIDKLGAGIVITGGGALLKNLPQLISYVTGFDVRLGLPNEHLATDTPEDVVHPMYSTCVGLILKGFEQMEKEMKYKAAAGITEPFITEPEIKPEVVEDIVKQPDESATEQDSTDDEPESHEKSKKKPFEGLKRLFGDFFDEKDVKM